MQNHTTKAIATIIGINNKLIFESLLSGIRPPKRGRTQVRTTDDKPFHIESWEHRISQVWGTDCITRRSGKKFTLRIFVCAVGPTQAQHCRSPHCDWLNANRSKWVREWYRLIAPNLCLFVMQFNYGQMYKLPVISSGLLSPMREKFYHQWERDREHRKDFSVVLMFLLSISCGPMTDRNASSI